MIRAEWKVVPWWRPPRWFGYKWARECCYGVYYDVYDSVVEYRTDKQMADELLAQMKPAQQSEAQAAKLFRSGRYDSV